LVGTLIGMPSTSRLISLSIGEFTFPPKLSGAIIN
jgi:hypothetical protein